MKIYFMSVSGFTQQGKLTSEKILRMVGKVQQSKRDLNFDQDLNVRITRIRLPRGGKLGKT